MTLVQVVAAAIGLQVVSALVVVAAARRLARAVAVPCRVLADDARARLTRRRRRRRPARREGS